MLLSTTLGKTLGLYGLSGTGKTTQAGEYAKFIYKRFGKTTDYHSIDMGGHESLNPLMDLGVVKPDYMEEEDDPWGWIGKRVTDPPDPNVGLKVFDSGSSMSEALMSSCAKLAAKGTQIGSQKSLTFKTPAGIIGSNTESHYMVVQTFMLDQIWKSTWLARRHNVDVLWTFGEHRAENPNDAPIVGPQLAGRALTGKIPKWLRYTLRLVTVPVEGDAARHILYLQEAPELNGTGMAFANARYPLDATTALPSSIEPASIVKFWELTEQGQEEAKANLKAELGL